MASYWYTPEPEPYIPPLFRNYSQPPPPTPYVPWSPPYYQQPPEYAYWTPSFYAQAPLHVNYHLAQHHEAPSVPHIPHSQPPPASTPIISADDAQKLMEKFDEICERFKQRMDDLANSWRLNDLRNLRQVSSVAQYWIAFSRTKSDIRFESEQQVVDIFVAGLTNDIHEELQQMDTQYSTLLSTYRLALSIELQQSGYFGDHTDDQSHVPETFNQELPTIAGMTLQWLYIIMQTSITYFYRPQPLAIYSTYLFLWFGRHQYHVLTDDDNLEDKVGFKRSGMLCAGQKGSSRERTSSD